MFVKVVHNGKEIDVPRAHARRLVENGRAQWPDRKDMQAEEVEVTAPIVIEAKAATIENGVEVSERTGKPKRQYKRRDMKAED